MQTALAAGMTENVEAGVPREGFVAGERGVPRLLVALPFVGGISLATFLFAYLASRFIHEAIEAAGTPGAGRLAVFVPVLLAVITVLGGLRWAVCLHFRSPHFSERDKRPGSPPRKWPLVSIFVPACNEAENIRGGDESLLVLDYPRYEVIVVDDGSTDGTYGGQNVTRVPRAMHGPRLSQGPTRQMERS